MECQLARGSRFLWILLIIISHPSVPASNLWELTGASTVLPPDPSKVAPPLDPNKPYDFGDSIEFIYRQEPRIQGDVEEGAIDTSRQAVLRGKVLARDGSPLPGVRVRVHGQPELGYTFSRLDGDYDIVVNGGELVSIRFDLANHFEAQRQLFVAANDYTFVPDVVLVQQDSLVTTVTLSGITEPVVHTGSMSEDLEGPRIPHIYLPPGRSAELIMSDGSRSPIETISVRVTEYTVGNMAAKAMPAELPRTTALTYCAEFSADEAIAAGASMLSFSQPLYFYLNNFVQAPAGAAIPLGYYDRETGTWKAEPDGICLQVVGIQAGIAELDGTGDGVAEDQAFLDLLDISEAERREIAGLYAIGESFWRAPLDHFSPFDANFPSRTIEPEQDPAPDDLPPPQGPSEPEAADEDNLDEPTQCEGSIISVQNQSLGQSIPIPNTSYSLRYESSRALGRTDSRSIRVPLLGDFVSPDLDSIRVSVTVAGKRYGQVLSVDEVPDDKTITLVWDGLDAYGRVVNGRIQAKVELVYVYPITYVLCFWNPDGRSFSRYPLNCPVGYRPREIVRFREWPSTRYVQVGGYTSRERDLGGWTIDVHHAFDPTSNRLNLGTGLSQRTDRLPLIAESLPGAYGNVGTMLLDPNGTFYIAPYNKFLNQVVVLRPDGSTESILTSGFPLGMALGRDGRLYYGASAPGQAHIIESVVTGELPLPVAGSRIEPTTVCNECSALEASISAAEDLAFGPDGSLYWCDTNPSQPLGGRVRRITPEGLVSSLAGNGLLGLAISRIATTNDGDLYLGGSSGGLRYLNTDGKLSEIIPSDGQQPPFDLLAASDADVSVSDMVVAPDGTLYIASQGYIHALSAKGNITTIAGTGSGIGDADLQWLASGQRIPALEAAFGDARSIALATDGSIYVLASSGTFLDNVGRIIKLTSPLPGVSIDEVAVPSPDGDEIFVFDLDGRHQRTLNASSRLVTRTFSYDSEGLLASISDTRGITAIERDGLGVITAIVDPLGERTEIGVEDGLITSITMPDDGEWTIGYDDQGLLSSFSDPDRNTKTYLYDDVGRLTDELGPEGDFRSIEVLSDDPDFKLLRYSTPAGTTTHNFSRGKLGRSKVSIVGPDGSENLRQTMPDGSEVIKTPDGMVTIRRSVADPAGNSGTITGYVEVSTPSGIKSVSASSRTAGSPSDGVTSYTDSMEVNGRTYTKSYDPISRTVSQTSPGGRVSQNQFDSAGRLFRTETSGRAITTYEYDERGRLSGYDSTDGTETRKVTYTYDGIREIVSTIDDGENMIGMTYDEVGRVHSLILNGIETATLGYTPGGNLSSITPLGKPATEYDYDGLRRIKEIRYPTQTGTATHSFIYNAFGKLDTVTYPDAEEVVFDYDITGRLNRIEQALAVTTVNYTPENRVLQIRISAATDDIENNLISGVPTVDGNSSDLELGDDGGSKPNIVALRFQNVSIPPGATIVSAHIQFTSDPGDVASDVGSPSLVIRGESNTEAATYSTSNPDDIPGRQLTSASANWNSIPQWVGESSGSEQRTPDLSPIIQEIISLPGWASGNPLAFQFSRDPGNERTALSFEGNAANAPLLEVVYRPQECCFAEARPASITRSASTPDARSQSLSFTYDGSLWKRSVYSGAVNGSIEFGYNPDFNIVSYRVNGGTAIDYTYDPDLNIIQAGAVSYAIDPDKGVPLGTTLGVLTSTRMENAFAEEKELVASGPGGEIFRIVYTRDEAGRVTSCQETIGGTTVLREFEYDPFNRLSAEIRDGVSTQYTYDTAGNRLTRSGGETGTYDVSDRPLSYAGATFTHNPRGQLESRTVSGQITEFHYDVYNALTLVDLPDGRIVEYAIDPTNRRVAKYIDGVKQYGLIYRNRFQVEALLDAADNIVAQYVYAMRTNVPDAMLKDGVWYQIISDENGSVRLVVDSRDGAVLQRMDYDAFGRILVDTNPGFQPFGFAGGLYDTETGLVRFGYRDYDPFSGRFTTPDPMGFRGGDFNLYAYAQGDPVNHTDSTGLRIDKAACQELRNILQLEKELGTFGAAKQCSNTLGNRCLNHFDNSGGGGNIMTAKGEIDLDWFTDLIVGGASFPGLGNPLSPGSSGWIVSSYIGAKMTWNLAGFSTGNREKFRPPFEDPGERNAVLQLILGNDTFADLFPPEWMEANCPQECQK